MDIFGSDASAFVADATDASVDAKTLRAFGFAVGSARVSLQRRWYRQFARRPKGLWFDWFR